MSLSPWDLSGQMGFDFDLYRPRRASYVFATRANRQRNESYRFATKSSLRHVGETKTDFIEGIVRKKRKESYNAAQQRDLCLKLPRPPNTTPTTTPPLGILNNSRFNRRHLESALDRTQQIGIDGASRNFTTIYETPELDEGPNLPTLRPSQSMTQISSVTVKRPSMDNLAMKKATSLSSLRASSFDQKNILTSLHEDKAFVLESVRRYRKNLIILSVGFLLVFTAFRAIQNIQSSLNGQNKLGVIAMGCVHSTMCLTCLFTPVLINKFTSKWTIILGLMFYLLWIAANFYPQFYTLIPTSIGVGFGQSLAWGAQVTYIQKLAADSSLFSQEMTQQELFKFNGIFLTLFQTSHIWGNLLSSLLLDNSVFERLQDNLTASRMEHFDSTRPQYCGKTDECSPEIPYIWEMEHTSTKQASTIVIQLMGGLFVFAFVGFAILALFLEKINAKASDFDKPCMQFVWTNVQIIHKHPKFRLLVPLLVFNGFEQGFIYADYTKSYITCTVGIKYIGYNMITLGVVNSVFSVLVGAISKHLPREAIVGMGAILQIGLLVFLLVWIPKEDLLIVFFIISGLWGICDAVWQTQCNYLVNVTCLDDHEIAFQNLRMLQGFGAALAFFLSAFVCASVKLYVLISLLVVSILCYVAVEIQIKHEELRAAREEAEIPREGQKSILKQNGGASTSEKLNSIIC